MNDKFKRKGGAEKTRDKNKKLLLEAGSKCTKLTEMFKKNNYSENSAGCSVQNLGKSIIPYLN